MIAFGHGTHLGLRRTRNEDTYYADAARGLFLVADGLGGHEHGEVAAALARDAMVERVVDGGSLPEAIRSAAEHLASFAGDRKDPLPMGTTMAALRIVNDRYEIAWIGDSRIYRLTDQLSRVTHDHSLVQALVEAGRLDPALAGQHPQRNVLTQALGITAVEQLHIGMAGGALARGSSFLLCTDGLNDGLDDASLAQTLRRQELAPQECVDHLILDALEAGGADNITAIVVRVS